MSTANKAQKYYAIGSPTINIPNGVLSGRNSPNSQHYSNNFESPKLHNQKPDMTDCNVKRARLLLDKKKKLFLDK